MQSIIFLGDIVGRVGRRAVAKIIPELRNRYDPSFIIANGENAAGGYGLDLATTKEILDAGVQFITSGNHIWNRREIGEVFKQYPTQVIRPANFQESAPGAGWGSVEHPSGIKLGVLNIIGRVFMGELVECPFAKAKQILKQELSNCELTLVDFHAEATSEKVALGLSLDGLATVVLGTHTHIPTADERIFEQGTAFISDVGMCGPYDSVIGMGPKAVISKFETGIPVRFEVPKKGRAIVSGIYVECNKGKASKIERIKEILD